MAIARFSTLPRKERDQFLPSGNLEWYQLVMTCREWYSLAYTGPDWSTLVQSDHNYGQIGLEHCATGPLYESSSCLLMNAYFYSLTGDLKQCHLREMGITGKDSFFKDKLILICFGCYGDQ